jgi:hypothetical protein
VAFAMLRNTNKGGKLPAIKEAIKKVIILYKWERDNVIKNL